MQIKTILIQAPHLNSYSNHNSTYSLDSNRIVQYNQHCISRTIVFLALTLPLYGLLIFRCRTFLIPPFNFCFAPVLIAQLNGVFFSHGQQQIRMNLSHYSLIILSSSLPELRLIGTVSMNSQMSISPFYFPLSK